MLAMHIVVTPPAIKAAKYGLFTFAMEVASVPLVHDYRLIFTITLLDPSVMSDFYYVVYARVEAANNLLRAVLYTVPARATASRVKTSFAY